MGHGNVLSRPRRPRRPGRESERNRARRNLPAADAGLRPAWRRRRCQWRLLVGALERPSRQLRPPQVQGAERACRRHRHPLPRRLVVLRLPWAAASGGDRQRQCRVQLLHLDRLARHLRSGTEHPHRHGEPQQWDSRPGRREIRRADRSLSDGVLRQERGWARRRPQCRLERQGLVVNKWSTNHVPPRGRQGQSPAGGQIPDAAEPARPRREAGLDLTKRG